MLPADSKLKRENTLLSIFLPKKPLEIKGENVLNYNMVIFLKKIHVRIKNICSLYAAETIITLSLNKYKVSLTTKQRSTHFYHFI